MDMAMVGKIMDLVGKVMDMVAEVMYMVRSVVGKLTRCLRRWPSPSLHISSKLCEFIC